MNDYYNPSGAISPFTLADARAVTSEFSGVQAGFEKIPSLAVFASNFGSINFREKISEAINGVAAVAVGNYFSSIDADGVTTHPNEFRIYKRISLSPFYEDQGDNALPTAFSHATAYPAGTVGAKLKQVVSVTDRPYSAAGDGAVDDRPAFFAANAAGGFSVPRGTYKIGSDLTLSNKVYLLSGAMLVIEDGVTLNILGDFDASLEQVFDCIGTGKVVFTKKPVRPRAEWWGAKLNDAGVNSAAALQKCIIAARSLYLPIGNYYGSAGLIDTVGTYIFGESKLLCGYQCSSPTDHLLSNTGTLTDGSGGYYRDFALARTVTPTTPALAADDSTQGHGIHLDLVSNPRVQSVYTYNNLVELYHSRCLSPQIDDVRGLRQTGGGTDRWTGYWVDGNPTGMPAPWNTGPSGNPSGRITNLNMVANPAVGTAGTANLSKNYRLLNHLQDLWMADFEAASGHVQFEINPNGYPCSDACLIRPRADGFLVKGFDIRNMGLGNNFTIEGAWMAPNVAAASAAGAYGLVTDQAHGLNFSAECNFSFAPAVPGIYSTNANNQKFGLRGTNCETPIYTISVSMSDLNVDMTCTLNGAAAGNLITIIGGSNNKVIAGGTASGTKKWIDAVATDASASLNSIDVTKVAAVAISGNLFTVAGAAIPLLNGAIVLQSGAAATLTGTLAETVLATLTVPAGWLGANGSAELADALWSMTNNANSKTLRARLGGIGGFAFWSQAVTTSASARGMGRVQNANATNAQKAYSGASFGNSASAILTGAIDTSVAQTIVITGQLANAGDTLTLESLLIRINPGA